MTGVDTKVDPKVAQKGGFVQINAFLSLVLVQSVVVPQPTRYRVPLRSPLHHYQPYSHTKPLVGPEKAVSGVEMTKLFPIGGPIPNPDLAPPSVPYPEGGAKEQPPQGPQSVKKCRADLAGRGVASRPQCACRLQHALHVPRSSLAQGPPPALALAHSRVPLPATPAPGVQGLQVRLGLEGD